MKISFVLGHELPFPPKKGGGVNSLLLGLCRGLVSIGHEVSVYSPLAEGLSEEEIDNGITHIRVKGMPRKKNHVINFIMGIPYVLRVMSRLKKSDVLSCHLLQGFLFTKNNKATIVTHTIHRDPKKFIYFFLKLDRIYVGSDNVAQDAKLIVPKIDNIIKTVYNCVDFLNYSQPTLKKRNGFIEFVYIGRFSRDKGVVSLIKGFCLAIKENPFIKLKCIGPITSSEGGDEELFLEMKELISVNGVSNYITICPPIFDREKLDVEIKNSDVVVLPSIGGETLNMSILECMRIGKALLISDLPANQPLVIENVTGEFVKAGDVESWKEKIITMSADIDRIEKFGENAYLYGREKFSCEKIADTYVKDFKKLIAEKRYRNG
ncbi:glycosyltransferase family 4 protein [Runella sp. MFBS21]|uniref:glycosyltransferase family 4 protein n=1 Tax=Runella sp. MFBS21 TaxID=3034018 RepID=UPI0023F7B84D|nr:glycosyltransferase family 4 protein [Runella sp. MFBS21]MDF7820407.1 glycosyltransferase family 4 protein [Runella sp. MFBS21]